MSERTDLDEDTPPCEHTAWMEITTYDDQARGWRRFLCEVCGKRFLQKDEAL